MGSAHAQCAALLAEEAAEQVLTDAIAALRLTPFQAQALAAAAHSYARARAARLVAEAADSITAPARPGRHNAAIRRVA